MYIKPFITLDKGNLGNNPIYRGYISKEATYIENLDYLILTEFKILKNEFWDHIFIFSVLSIVSLISKICFRYV